MKFYIIYNGDSKLYLEDMNLHGIIGTDEWSEAYRFDTYEEAYTVKKVIDAGCSDSISIIEVDVHFEW